MRRSLKAAGIPLRLIVSVHYNISKVFPHLSTFLEGAPATCRTCRIPIHWHRYGYGPNVGIYTGLSSISAHGHNLATIYLGVAHPPNSGLADTPILFVFFPVLRRRVSGTM